jgi:UDP-glucose 4-epimerase
VNVLITGYLDSIASSLIANLVKDKGNKIILAGKDIDEISTKFDHITVHAIDPVDPLFQTVMDSYDLDTIIFIPMREEQLLTGVNQLAGHLLDGLIKTLDYCKDKSDIWFILISSTEVYEKIEIKQISHESQLQETALNKNILLTCEQYCQYYSQFYDLNTSIVRVPFVYGPNETNSLLHNIIKNCTQNDNVLIPASKDTSCSFIHEKDIATFIHRLLDEKYYHDYKVFNLASSDTITFKTLTQSLNTYFPKVKFTFQESKKVSTKSVDGILSKQEFDWSPSYKLRDSLESIINNIRKKPDAEIKPLDKIKQNLSEHPNFLKWIEVILGGALMQGLNYLTGTFIQFKYIDFRLLYVILIGSAYGMRFALVASIIAGVSNLYSWYQLGMDWELLIYHVENWLPIALYLIAGSVSGYLWDKRENEISFSKKQLSLIQEKYAFLYNIYEDIRKTKDKLREQLIGYRDSFGRIYSITRELDSLNSNDVFLKALDILEDVMNNKNVAIYSLDQSVKFARLEVNSFSLSKNISKSLNMSEYPEAVSVLKEGEIFQNKDLLPAYPSLIAPIMKDDQPMGLIIIWERTFDQFSMYYQNLFKIISGLVQSSLVHAILFREANLEKWYIPSTKILEPDFFKETLRIKTVMQNRNISRFQLISIEKENMDWKKFNSILEKGIRSSDYAGLLNKDDTVCYVILSQAEETNIELIIARLVKLGLKCKIIESSIGNNV